MRECEARVWASGASAVFLDCVDGGFLPGYYGGLRYAVLARKDITYPSGNLFPVALMSKEAPNLGLRHTGSASSAAQRVRSGDE